MDQENSSTGSFEDLGNLNENELKEMNAEIESKKMEESEKSTQNEGFMDILGNGQLTKQVLIKGKDEFRPMSGDVCEVSFVGKLEDGTEIENVQNMKLHLGDNEVVQGLDMSIALMNQGEKAEITVNSRFAYGDVGLKNENDDKELVPPGATIIYTVELIDFKPEDEDECKTFEYKKTIGNRKRERGNFWFKRNEYNLAIQLYRKALEYLDENHESMEPSPELSNTELQELLEMRMVVYNNLAGAQTKIQAFDVALKSIENVLRCQPNNVKALYRKAKIVDAQGDTNGAIALFQKAANLDPDNKSFQNELSKLILKRSREQRNEKNLYQKMLGQAQKMEQKPKKAAEKRTQSPSKWKPMMLLGSILVGVAGIAFYRSNF